MRVSFESGVDTTSFCLAVGETSSLQHPTPAIVAVVLSLMQYPCGASVVGAWPEPGWCCLGGSAYWPTDTSRLVSCTAGVAVFSDAVFVIDHTTICDDV